MEGRIQSKYIGYMHETVRMSPILLKSFEVSTLHLLVKNKLASSTCKDIFRCLIKVTKFQCFMDL